MSDPKSPSAELIEAQALINALLEDRLSPGDADRLEQLVSDHGEILDLYVRYLHQECVVAAHFVGAGYGELGESSDKSEGLSAVDPNETMILPSIHLENLDADGPEGIFTPAPFHPPITKRQNYRWIIGGIAATIFICVGLLFWGMRSKPDHLAIHPPVTPAQPNSVAINPPATIAPAIEPPAIAFATDGYRVQWERSKSPQATGGISAGRELSLTSGVTQIDFGSGVRLIVEAPARFVVDTPGELRLLYGSLSAVVPPTGHGFVVATSSSRVIDLGTEFGVRTESAGGTLVNVFKGTVNVAADGNPSVQTIHTGASAEISDHKMRIDPAGASPQNFVRSLSGSSISLDVTDLLAGGDGTTRNRGMAIDLLTCKCGQLPYRAETTADCVYRPISVIPVLDGGIVPNGHVGPIQIDSVGDRLFLPATSGLTYDYVWAGGPVLWRQWEHFSAVLGTVNYDTPDHGFIFMHANGAVTLDLRAIRRLHPGNIVSRFSCVAGNSFASVDSDPKNAPPKASIYIAVNGKSQFSKIGFTNTDGPFPINVNLKEDDRFLTLITTDGGENIRGDWIIFGDPKLDSGE